MAGLDQSDRALRGRDRGVPPARDARLAGDLEAGPDGFHGLVRAPRRPGRNVAAGGAGSASRPCPIGPFREARLPVGEGETEALGSPARRSMSATARAPLVRAGPRVLARGDVYPD